jgi:hypothetical protein
VRYRTDVASDIEAYLCWRAQTMQGVPNVRYQPPEA